MKQKFYFYPFFCFPPGGRCLSGLVWLLEDFFFFLIYKQVMYLCPWRVELCLQTLKQLESKQWEVNVHSQNARLIWLINFILSRMALATELAASSQ